MVYRYLRYVSPFLYVADHSCSKPKLIRTCYLDLQFPNLQAVVIANFNAAFFAATTARVTKPLFCWTKFSFLNENRKKLQIRFNSKTWYEYLRKK